MFGFLIPYIEITIPVSLIIVSVLLLRPLFDKRYAAKLRYFIWLIIAIRLIFPYDIAFYNRPAPPVQITLPDAVLYSRPVNNDNNAVILPEADDKQTETLPPSADDKPVQVLPEAETPARLTVLEVVSLIWVCGTLSVFLYLIGRYFIVSAKHVRAQGTKQPFFRKKQSKTVDFVIRRNFCVLSFCLFSAKI